MVALRPLMTLQRFSDSRSAQNYELQSIVVSDRLPANDIYLKANKKAAVIHHHQPAKPTSSYERHPQTECILVTYLFLDFSFFFKMMQLERCLALVWNPKKTFMVG